jgi:hypothetical protein
MDLSLWALGWAVASTVYSLYRAPTPVPVRPEPVRVPAKPPKA